MFRNLRTTVLELLKDHNSPEDKGKIYAKIASMYAGHGYSSPNDIRIAKTVEYCRKALEQPLDLITTCEMYSRLSDSQIAPYLDGPEIEFTKARKEAIVTCLTGLKLVLDNNVPNELKKPPGGGGFYTVDGDPNNPEYRRTIEELRKKNELSLAERRKWEFEQKLYILRRASIDGCAGLYAYKPPYDTNELENFARDILKGHEDAVDEIITKARQLIPQQGNK